MADEAPEAPTGPITTLTVRLFDLSGLPEATDVRVELQGIISCTSQPSSDGQFITWPPLEGSEDFEEVATVALAYNEDLLHQLSHPCLSFRVLDAEQAPIGPDIWLDLSDFLHTRAVVEGTVVVPLSEQWDAKWDNEPPPDENVAEGEQEIPRPPTREKVDTTISYEIRVGDLVAPDADRHQWSVLTLNFGPCTGVPEELAADTFSLWCWGHQHTGAVMEDGALTWPQTYHWYCGKEFLLRLNDTLNNMGGTWAFVVAEDKEEQKAKAWVDLRPLLNRGTQKMAQDISFVNPEWADASLHVDIELRFPVVPRDPPPLPDLDVQVSRRKGIQKFPHSHDAMLEMVDGVERAIESFADGYKIHQETEVFSLLTKRAAEEALWGPVHKIFREKFRKGVGIVKDVSKPLEGDEKDEFFSTVFADLSNTMVDVMRKHSLVFEKPEEKEARDFIWVESRDDARRCRRLAREAEMSSNWSRAAKLHQTILSLGGTQETQLNIWSDYGLFLLRAHERDGAAEEALLHSVTIGDENKLTDSEAHTKAYIGLICLGLQRGRYIESQERLASLHDKNLSSSLTNILNSLLHFLQGKFDVATKYMQLACKPEKWFKSLANQDAVFDKLRLFAEMGGRVEVKGVARAYEQLWYILDLGFPKLIFTILDAPELNEDLSTLTTVAKFIEAATYLALRDYGALIECLEVSGPWDEFESERMRMLGEAYFQSRGFEKAERALLQAAQPEMIEKYPALLIRLGHCHLLKKQWSLGSDYFLRSLRKETTAEAWAGLAFASYRNDRLDLAYEALCEALWLDRDRCDVWAFLTLIHLRNRCDELSISCFRQTLTYAEESGDELLLEIAIEMLKSPRIGMAELAEVAARTALRLRETGQGHEVLADSFALQDLHEKAILECGVAIRLLYDKPKQRGRIAEKAIRWSELLNDPPLAESIHIAEKLASIKLDSDMDTRFPKTGDAPEESVDP
eukprot:GEMP01010507.1.p1 GENE.GEMP01010507.1~~GEMP01010507.1.p1  ORF type:complete len:968 (+),score=244.00 GEMP01010507.1:34-2937(+)